MTTQAAVTSVRIAADRPRSPVRVELRSGLLACRLISRGVGEAEVALLAGSALLLGGDAITIDIAVGPGCRLRLLDVGGTVAYDGEGRRSSWDATVTVAENAVLHWDGLPFVVSDGADVRRRTTIELADGAGLRLRETVVLGRSGERGGTIMIDTAVRDARGPVLTEQVHVAGQSPVPGVVGDHRVLDSLLCLGPQDPPPTPGATRLDLERGGVLLRWLGDQTHRSPLH